MLHLSDVREQLTEENESGFTLIELMVVVLIIAILIGIAVPTFLGVRRSAQDRAAQSSLRNAYTNAKALYADDNSYIGATTEALNNAEPSLEFITGESTDPKDVSLATPTANAFGAAAASESGTCFYIYDVATGGTAGTKYGSESDDCFGADAATRATADEW